MDSEIVDIKEFMVINDIFKMKFVRYYFIWLNGRVSYKIDRSFCIIEWKLFLGYIIIEYWDVNVFDYTFIFIYVIQSI